MIQPNNIYCGDCYELIKQIPDKSVDLVYTDIPYLIACGGGNDSELSKRIRKRNNELDGKDQMEQWKQQVIELKDKMDHAKSKDEYEKYHVKRGNLLNMINLKSADITNGIDYSIFDEYMRVMKKMNIFIWCSKLQILDIMNYFAKFGNYDILVWCKRNCVPATNNMWLPNMEHCLYFREKGVRLNDGYELKSKWFISSTNKEDKDKYLHPTIKPLELVKTHILHTTQEGGGCPRYIYG